MKTSDKIALISALTGGGALVVATVALFPAFEATSTGADGKTSQPPSMSPTKPGTPTPPGGSGDPIKIAGIGFPIYDGHSMVTKDLLSKGDVRPTIKRLNKEGLDSTARSIGGVDVDMAIISVHMSGNRPTPVRIVNMHAVTRCEKPLAGTFFFNPNAGSNPSPKIGFDLDQPNPPARAASLTDSGKVKLGGEYFVDHEYDLKYQEPVTFSLMVTTKLHYCEFHFVADLLVDDKPVTQPIDDNGKPFTVSAGLNTQGRYSVIYDLPAYKMFFTSPIASLPAADGERTWQLGDPLHPPEQ